MFLPFFCFKALLDLNTFRFKERVELSWVSTLVRYSNLGIPIAFHQVLKVL